MSDKEALRPEIQEDPELSLEPEASPSVNERVLRLCASLSLCCVLPLSSLPSLPFTFLRQERFFLSGKKYIALMLTLSLVMLALQISLFTQSRSFYTASCNVTTSRGVFVNTTTMYDSFVSRCDL